MSKMRMPEMNVVRFEESDVICASGFYTVSGSSDTTGYNLSITDPLGTTIFKNSNTGPSINEMGSYGGDDAAFYYSRDTNSVDLWTMIDSDSRNPGFSLPGVNGDYIWNGKTFEKQ